MKKQNQVLRTSYVTNTCKDLMQQFQLLTSCDSMQAVYASLGQSAVHAVQEHLITECCNMRWLFEKKLATLDCCWVGDYILEVTLVFGQAGKVAVSVVDCSIGFQFTFRSGARSATLVLHACSATTYKISRCASDRMLVNVVRSWEHAVEAQLADASTQGKLAAAIADHKLRITNLQRLLSFAKTSSLLLQQF